MADVILEQLKVLADRNKLTIYSVAGHSGITENPNADE